MLKKTTEPEIVLEPAMQRRLDRELLKIAKGNLKFWIEQSKREQRLLDDSSRNVATLEAQVADLTTKLKRKS